MIFGLGYFLAFAASALYGPLAPSALMAIGFGAAAIGHASGLLSFVRIVAQPLWGNAADKTGRGQELAALSFALGAITLFAIAFARTEGGLSLGYVMLGAFGGSGVTLLDGTVIESVAGDRSRFSRIRVLATLGYAVTTLLVSALRDASLISTRPGAVFLPASVLFALTATLLVWHPQPRATHVVVEPAVFARGPFAKLVVIATLQWASHAAYTLFVMPLGAAQGLRPFSIGLAIFAGLTIEALVMHNAHRIRTSAETTFAIVTLLATLRWLLYPFAQGPVAFIALSMLHGMTFGLFFPTLVAETSRLAGSRSRHRAQSLATSIIFGVGGAAGTFLAGMMLDRYGAAACWWSMAPLSFCAFLFSSAGALKR
jgi:MFS transporter, PPP family, 3-phenylpropionic acid transporter